MERIGIQSTTLTGHLCFKPVIEADDPVGQWKFIQGVFISRHCRFTILENIGNTNELHIKDARGHWHFNPQIRELDTYHLHQELPPDITNEEMQNARAQMMLNEKEEVVLKVTISG